MSEVSEAIQAKCLSFGDRIIKLNDYLLEQAAKPQPSAFRHHTSRVPVHLKSVAALANQLLRSGRFSSTAEGKVNEYRSKATSGAVRAE